ncbi:hypothetical protein DPMN_097546 [Dreissena polymorpha]|uniref:Uncharacterized protein n=1 Tax=Dreissena polymorpha TaxID=45954 RepID=A0A9D4R4N5_DREPO|nr:hypothetical protein DPMN_097546 [Dreissena polymorpha]
MEVDIYKKLIFPSTIIVQTNHRSGIVLWSDAGKRLIVMEFTVPWETICLRKEKGQVHKAARSMKP